MLRIDGIKVWVAVALVCMTSTIGFAAGREKKTAVSSQDWQAVKHCLDIIRQCQMHDGMIRMKAAGDSVWTVPYFSNFAAMALLAASDVRPNPQDVRRVERWLLWYADNQEVDGTICDRQGTVSSYKSYGIRDSTDSYAATFLMAVWRYQQAVKGDLPPKISHAAGKALAAIEAVVQNDGLTIAKPDYPVKYLMDNIEVYGGLAEGALFFDSVDDKKEAEKARKMAARIAVGLGKYWSMKDRRFAYALDRRGEFSGGLSKPYPHGLAQLFALAHVTPPRAELWRDIRKRFRPDDDGVPVERWLIAATRCAEPEEIEELRQATRETMLKFSVNNVYVHRPAVAVLALVDGRARFPNVPTSNKE